MRRIYGCLALALISAAKSESLNERALIVGGENASKGRYPYFVTLKHFGGGALIAPDIVLTAGHCKPQKHTTVRPHVGTYSRHDDDDAQEYNIVQMVRHPEFDQKGDDEFQHDFLLLKLDSQVSTTSVVVLPKINRNQYLPKDGQQVTVMGMGVMNQDASGEEQFPQVLQQASLNAMSNEACSKSNDLERNETYQDRIFASHLCTTGGPNNERDSCSYDSGGPIIIPNGAATGQDLIVGLVSWGMECGDPDFPGVNARVSQVSDWIDETVCAISDFPPADFCVTSSQETTSLVPNWKVTLCYTILFVGIILALLRRVVDNKRRKMLDDDSAESLSLCDSDSSSNEYEYSAIEVM